MISLFLFFAILIAIACHLPAWVGGLIVIAMAIDVGFTWGRWRRRDVLWIHGYHGRTAQDREAARASADEIRSGYRQAGLRTPIILNVPDRIVIKSNPLN